MTDPLKNVSQPKDWNLIVEKDVKIPMRDGAILYADVLRPDTGGERVPAIMNIGPYQKDRLWIPPHGQSNYGQRPEYICRETLHDVIHKLPELAGPITNHL